METIELGPVPAGEPCAQVGTANYLARSMLECEVFRRMLERVLPIPEGLPVKYVVRSHPHDFGTYREVSVRYSCDAPAACDFAFRVESSVPEGWDPVAQHELADLIGEALFELERDENLAIADQRTHAERFR